jgi:hypothetical protein
MSNKSATWCKEVDNKTSLLKKANNLMLNEVVMSVAAKRESIKKTSEVMHDT